MRKLLAIGVVAVAAISAGCATSQNVVLAQTTPSKPIATAAFATEEGNSSDMDGNLRAALIAQNITPTMTLPAGTRKTSDADMIVTYTDSWRWDIVMYLRNVTINMFDAQSGNMLATARWDNSVFHGFQDSRLVVKDLVDQMLVKIRATTPKS